jgi:hypothetical protein
LVDAGRENRELKEALLARVAELEKCRDEVARVSEVNAELRTKLQTCAYRVDELTKALDREREASQVKQRAAANAVKVQCDEVVDAWAQKVGACRAVIAALLRDEFGVLDVDGELDGLLEQLNREIAGRETRQEIFADCMKLRRAFGWEDSAVSLVDVFARSDAAVKEQKAVIERLESSLRDLRASAEDARREIARLEQFKPEIAQWVNWSRALLIELAGPSAATMAPGDARVLLEEACFSSVGNRSLMLKLAMLRDEKKLFTNARFDRGALSAAAGPRHKIMSVRPIVGAVLALRIFQGLSGVLPLHLTAPDVHGGLLSMPSDVHRQVD